MPPDLKNALSVLLENETLLRARGVRRAAVFGSVARGEAGNKSDVDILVEIDPAQRIGLFGYAGLCADIEALFPGKVDVVNANTIKPRFRQSILSEAVYAF